MTGGPLARPDGSASGVAAGSPVGSPAGPAPVVAIVGRPNVGKSTLFNRLMRERRAIVDDRPGVTVDRLEASWSLDGRPVTLVDTGGIGLDDGGGLQDCIAAQVDAALDVADLVLFVVDGTAGLTPLDERIADRLRRQGLPVLLVANKAERPESALEFFALGLGEPVAVSALHGHGLRALREALAERIPWPEGGEAAEDARVIAQLAVIGRPNVGKSTLINAWLGRERMAVSPVAGTTRDAVDVDLSWKDESGEGVVRLVDTAGQRRRSRIRDAVELVARVKARQAFARADAAVLVLDAAAEVAEQDMRLLGLAWEKGCALVVAVNKVDLLDHDAWTRFAERLDFRLRGLPDVPVCRVSAAKGKGVRALLKKAVNAARRNRTELGTGELNRWLERAQTRQHPPSDDGAVVRMKYCTQTATRPPTIRIFCNRPDAVRQSYRRYLERDFRRCFDLAGVPVRLELAATDNPYDDGRRRKKR